MELRSIPDSGEGRRARRRHAPPSSAGTIAVGILLVLAGINAAWAVTRGHSGPLLASAGYALVAVLCRRWGHFRAGIVAGVLGLGIHACDLVFQGTVQPAGVDLGLLWANTALPIPLVYFSYKAFREVDGAGENSPDRPDRPDVRRRRKG
jgi:hypothetical protein